MAVTLLGKTLSFAQPHLKVGVIRPMCDQGEQRDDENDY